MKWLLLVGARSDIARAVGHRFAAAGFHLYLAGRNTDELEKDAADYRIRHRVETRVYPLDALDLSSHASFYKNLDPKPEGVVCAVGYLGDGRLARNDWEEASRILNTNLTGCISVLDLVACDMAERGSGFIIGISSVAGDRGRASNPHYGAAKAGFSAYLSALRNRLFKKGVHVLTVKPGFVRTRMTAGMRLPAALTATPEQVAHDIFRAWRKKKDICYTRWYWRWIMSLIKLMPEFVFKRSKL